MFIDVLIFSLIYLFIDVLINTTTEKDHGDQRKLHLQPRQQLPFSAAIIGRLRTPHCRHHGPVWHPAAEGFHRLWIFPLVSCSTIITVELLTKNILRLEKIWKNHQRIVGPHFALHLLPWGGRVFSSNSTKLSRLAAAWYRCRKKFQYLRDSWWAKHSSCTTSVSDTGAM